MQPCPYCKGNKVNKNGLKTNQKGRFQQGKHRTIGNIKKWNELWGKETNLNRSLIKNYFNVEYPPIYVKPDMENLKVYLFYPHPIFTLGF